MKELPLCEWVDNNATGYELLCTKHKYREKLMLRYGCDSIEKINMDPDDLPEWDEDFHKQFCHYCLMAQSIEASYTVATEIVNLKRISKT